MLLRLKQAPEIEDLRNHGTESIETLRSLLGAGAPARPDPRRRDFYEVDNCSRVFYIHITPMGKVWLLAIWAKDPAQPNGSEAALRAAREATAPSSGLLRRAHASC